MPIQDLFLAKAIQNKLRKEEKSMNKRSVTRAQLLPEFFFVFMVALFLLFVACGVEFHPLLVIIAFGPPFCLWYAFQRSKPQG
jgi:hypothetical protein